jgi:uncharacterized protein YdaU (DUF1376 family)
MVAETFRSPISKLLTFFHRSRDRWREKCKQAKKELKSLKTCHAKLKASRDYWKQKARQAAQGGTGPEPTEPEPPKNAGLASAVAGSYGPPSSSGTAAAGRR